MFYLTITSRGIIIYLRVVNAYAFTRCAIFAVLPRRVVSGSTAHHNSLKKALA